MKVHGEKQKHWNVWYTHSGMEPSSFIHGQESVTEDPFDADDPLRNRKELQDTWEHKQHALTIDWWQCIYSPCHFVNARPLSG